MTFIKKVFLKAKKAKIMSLKDSFWSFGDQCVISLSSFLTTLLVARAMAPKEFGVFVLIYTILQISLNLQNALIIQPMNIISAGYGEKEKKLYYNSLFIWQLLLAFLLVVLTLVISIFFKELFLLLLIMGANIIVSHCQEFSRRIFYVYGNTKRVFFMDLFTHLLLNLSLYFLFLNEILTGQFALITMCLSYLIGFILFSNYYKIGINKLDSSIFFQHWKYGKWLLGSEIAQRFSVQVYPILTATLISTSSTAGYRSVLNILGLTHPLLTAIEYYIMPKSASIYKKYGIKSLYKYMINTVKVTFIPFFIIIILVFFFSDEIIRYLYGDSYLTFSFLLKGMSIIYLSLYLQRILSIFLRATGNTKPFFYGYIFSTIATGTLGVWFIKKWELTGILVSNVLNNILIILVTLIPIILIMIKKKRLFYKKNTA